MSQHCINNKGSAGFDPLYSQEDRRYFAKVIDLSFDAKSHNSRLYHFALRNWI